MLQQRFDLCLEILLIHAIDFGRNFQMHAAANGDLNGPVGPFLRRDATQKRQILSLLESRLVQVSRKSVMYVPDPIRTRKGSPLSPRNRNHGCAFKGPEKSPQVREVQPSMQRADAW